MDGFLDVFLRPLFPAISVASFVAVGLLGSSWGFALAAGFAYWFMALEVQRASGWGRR